MKGPCANSKPSLPSSPPSRPTPSFASPKKPLAFTGAAMDDLFELDQGVDADVPVAVATPAPAAPRLRLARDEDDERSTRKRAALLQLDEGDAALDADVSAVREDELGRLLRREAELLRRKGAAAALNAQHCFWLLEGTSDEASVLASVQAMGPMVKEAADSLRASLAAFSTYGAPSERRELEQALELLEGEHATWTLLHATLSDLRAFEEQQPLADADALELAAHDEWISDESFFLLATRHDATLRRWLRVIVWLETLGLDAAARTERVRCDRFWEYTHMALARGGVGDVGDDDDDGNRQQWPTEKSADSSLQRLLVRSLDVDAPLQSGDQQRQLHSMDASLDARLLRRLWALVTSLRAFPATRLIPNRSAPANLAPRWPSATAASSSGAPPCWRACSTTTSRARWAVTSPLTREATAAPSCCAACATHSPPTSASTCTSGPFTDCLQVWSDGGGLRECCLGDCLLMAAYVENCRRPFNSSHHRPARAAHTRVQHVSRPSVGALQGQPAAADAGTAFSDAGPDCAAGGR